MCYNCKCRAEQLHRIPTDEERRAVCQSPNSDYVCVINGQRVVLPALFPAHRHTPRHADPPKKQDSRGILRFWTGWRVNHCWHGEECWSQGVKCNRHHPIMLSWGFRHCRKGVHCADSTCRKVHPPRPLC
jgi:hypothetical protein